MCDIMTKRAVRMKKASFSQRYPQSSSELQRRLAWGPESGSSKGSDVSDDAKVLLGVAVRQEGVSGAVKRRQKEREPYAAERKMR